MSENNYDKRRKRRPTDEILEIIDNRPTDEKLEITDYDMFIKGYTKKSSVRPIDLCPCVPGTEEYDKWIMDYMSKPNEMGVRPIDYCPCVPGTEEYDKWIMDYMSKPIDENTAEQRKGLNKEQDIFSRGQDQILDKTEISVRPIDYCPCVPTEEYDKWIKNYMSKPNEMGVRPIDYCPCVPGTEEYDKWVMDYMTRPIDENKSKINPKNVAESALKGTDYETAVSAKKVEDQELTEELEGVDLGDND